MSPMKWFMLNLMTQSSIIQMISFLNNLKGNHAPNSLNNTLLKNKLPWKW